MTQQQSTNILSEDTRGNGRSIVVGLLGVALVGFAVFMMFRGVILDSSTSDPAPETEADDGPETEQLILPAVNSERYAPPPVAVRLPRIASRCSAHPGVAQFFSFLQPAVSATTTRTTTNLTTCLPKMTRPRLSILISTCGARNR